MVAWQPRLNPSFTFLQLPPLPQFTDDILSPFFLPHSCIWCASVEAGMFKGELLQNPFFPEMIHNYFLLPQDERIRDLVFSSIIRLVQGAICIHLWQKIKLHANIVKVTPYQKASSSSEVYIK